MKIAKDVYKRQILFCPKTILSFNSLAVAGAGTGRMPWAHFTVPPPTFIEECTIFSIFKLSSKIAVPTISIIESTAPTSWKHTSSIFFPCTSASAVAIFSKISKESFLAFSEILQSLMSFFILL